VATIGVGVLYNRALTEPLLARELPVDYVEVIPDRCWQDEGYGAEPRFLEFPRDIAVIERLAVAYPLVAHGVGLSIAAASRFDTDYLEQLAQWRRRFTLSWVSEHLAAVRASAGGVVDVHAGIALPLAWDEELLQLLIERAQAAADILGSPLLLENGTVHTPVPEPDMSEVEFLNRLTAESGCRLLLDLHNLFVNAVNLGIDPFAFLDSLDLAAVEEVHIAGGNELHGTYLDSHAGPCPDEVWDLLAVVVPRAPHLRGITFEFHESYFSTLGIGGLERELCHAAAIGRASDVVTGVPAGDR
jgi:uncharacterized protein